jgi:hypothetical protein
VCMLAMKCCAAAAAKGRSCAASCSSCVLVHVLLLVLSVCVSDKALCDTAYGLLCLCLCLCVCVCLCACLTGVMCVCGVQAPSSGTAIKVTEAAPDAKKKQSCCSGA